LENKKLVFCENVEPSGRHDGDLLHIKFVGKKCIGCKLKSERKNPSKNKTWKEFPVTDVSWDKCQDFIKKLNIITYVCNR
jgi:hypothetical protein